jgi:hypothetical protein
MEHNLETVYSSFVRIVQEFSDHSQHIIDAGHSTLMTNRNGTEEEGKDQGAMASKSCSTFFFIGWLALVPIDDVPIRDNVSYRAPCRTANY